MACSRSRMHSCHLVFWLLFSLFCGFGCSDCDSDKKTNQLYVCCLVVCNGLFLMKVFDLIREESGFELCKCVWQTNCVFAKGGSRVWVGTRSRWQSHLFRFLKCLSFPSSMWCGMNDLKSGNGCKQQFFYWILKPDPNLVQISIWLEI